MAEVKPIDVQLGVVELFSILLPGTLLAAVSVELWQRRFPAPVILGTEGSRWVAFALLAYALGHFVFLLASLLDGPCDAVRNRRSPLAEDATFQLARRSRDRFFGRPDGAADDFAINSFQWAKALLVLRAPAAAAVVEHLEAESKFFRSLVVVLPIAAILLAATGSVAAIPLLLGPTLLSAMRYAERRQKMTTAAFRFVAVLDRLTPDGPIVPRPAGSA